VLNVVLENFPLHVLGHLQSVQIVALVHMQSILDNQHVPSVDRELMELVPVKLDAFNVFLVSIQAGQAKQPVQIA